MKEREFEGRMKFCLTLPDLPIQQPEVTTNNENENEKRRDQIKVRSRRNPESTFTFNLIHRPIGKVIAFGEEEARDGCRRGK